ncbi:MAG: ATP phosphoribosyltransferase regulatory subunit [Polyangiales bacterium]
MASAGDPPKLRPAEAVAHSVPLAPPSGMHDLLPPAALARANVRRRVSETFGLFGYEQVTTPVFELAEVIERGLETVDRRDLLRFVEPDTGEVALLRPDITPQIARIVATTLAHKPAPYRLAYEGTVIRRRRGRARRQQQVFQCGVECIGLAGPEADVEVIELAARACENVGLRDFRIELAQVHIGRALLSVVPEDALGLVVESIARKDELALERQLVAAGVPKKARGPLLALVGLYGGVDVLSRARKLFRDADASAALDALATVVERLESAGLGGRLGVDLGELRGQSYYTGVSFTILAHGPGEPVGAGGRYDNLLERFHAPAPATGFALDIDNLEWALRDAGISGQTDRKARFAVASGDPALAVRTAASLRAAGYTAGRIEATNGDRALAYAAAWEYDCALVAGPKGLRAHRVADGATRPVAALDGPACDALAAWAKAAPLHEGT